MRLKNAHVISYDWQGFSPILTVYHEGELIDMDMSTLRNIDISASKTIWCIGSFTDEGYRPCPNNAIVGEFRQCQDCAKPIIPVLSCIFEPQCDGSLCNVEFCSREHVVYLAFFGRLMKVGMTSLKRARKRAIEQGADAYAVIKRLPNRLAARNFEKHISLTYDIKQAHSLREILKDMTKPIDRDDIKIRMSSTMVRIKDDIDTVPELTFLDEYPIELPLRRVPILRPTATRHAGKVLGIKGRFLIYEHSGLYAMDLSDLVGRRINALF